MVKKIIIGLLIFGLLLLLTPVGLVLTSDLWLGQALAMGIEKVTGFPTQIEKTHLDLKASQFGVYGVQIKNPKGFQEGVFAAVPEIYVDFDLSQFLGSRKLYFQEIRLNIEEVAVIRNHLGETNLSKLKAIKKSKTEVAQEQEKVKKAPSPKALDFFVEELVLTMRKVRYRDEANRLIGDKHIDMHITGQVYRNIANPADIIRIIVLQITYKAALGNLGLPVDMLKGQLDQSLAISQQLATESMAQARQLGEQALGEGKRLMGQTVQNIPVDTETVEKAVNDVANKAKNLFGSAGNFLKKTAESAQEKSTSGSSN